MTAQRFYTALEFTSPMSQNAKALTFNAPNWVWPGDVLSTSVKGIPANLGGFAKIASARLVAVWTPQAGAVLRLVHADTGPSNIQNLGEWLYPAVTGTPTSGGLDVTDALQAVLGGGVWKQIGIQVSGAGTLNRATLEIVWEIDLSDIVSRLEALELASSSQPEPTQEIGTVITVPPEGVTITFQQSSSMS